jgi:hypothetical protein
MQQEMERFGRNLDHLRGLIEGETGKVIQFAKLSPDQLGQDVKAVGEAIREMDHNKAVVPTAALSELRAKRLLAAAPQI